MVASPFSPLSADVSAARQRLETMFHDLASGSPSEFLTEWDTKKTEHLPLSLTVLCDPLAAVHQQADGSPPRISSAVWAAHRRYRESPSEEKTLLLVTGFSTEQLVLSMALHVTAFSCRRVIPVSTRYAWGKSENGANIQAWWDALRSVAEHLPKWDKLVSLDDRLLDVQELSPSNVFKQIRHWLKGNPALRDHVAIDATGGTKPMDSGASACAAYYDLPAYYIHTTEYNSDLRRPLPHSAAYSLLDRPSATFSRSSRESVYHAFSNRHFALAAGLASELTREICTDGGEFYGYFDEVDRRSCTALTKLIQCSTDWLTIGYCQAADRSADDSDTRELSPPLQAQTGRVDERPGTLIDAFLREHSRKNVNPREIIRELRQHSRTEDGWELSMQYFVCEYYRLCCLMNRDPTQIFGEDGGSCQSPPPENVREVLTVGYGLAECVLDSMLNLPACWRRMHVQWKCQPPESANSSTWNALFEWGWISPDPDFLYMQYGKKIALLCGGETFESVRTTKKPLPGTYDTDELRKLLELAAHHDYFPVLRGPLLDNKERSQQHQCNVTIKLRTSSKIKRPSPILKGCGKEWTRFLGFPEDAWSEARNAITHVRVPVTKTMIDTANAAMSAYLPRMIELYRRIATVAVDEGGNEVIAGDASPALPLDLPSSMADNWVTWRGEDDWKPSRFVPWIGRSDDVRKWLGLEL